MSDIIKSSQSQIGVSEEKVDNLIGALLRFGVLFAAAIVMAGGIPYLIANGSAPVHFGAFHGESAELGTVGGIVRGALALHSRAVIQLGVLALIATPVARVVLSLFAFAKQRDRTYVVITGIVLAILLWSLSSGSGI